MEGKAEGFFEGTAVREGRGGTDASLIVRVGAMEGATDGLVDAAEGFAEGIWEDVTMGDEDGMRNEERLGATEGFRAGATAEGGLLGAKKLSKSSW